MANGTLLKAMKSTIQDYATLPPSVLASRLRDPEAVKKLKKAGVNETQIHRIILILQQNQPDSKEFSAYLNSKLV
jgi:hypothetical protein